MTTNYVCQTALDWHPVRVDLLTMPMLARHFRVPIVELRRMEWHDTAFPAWRRNARGERVWRLPDVGEYLDGAR